VDNFETDSIHAHTIEEILFVHEDLQAWFAIAQKTISQSINLSINQSINQLIDQSIDRSINRSINQ